MVCSSTPLNQSHTPKVSLSFTIPFGETIRLRISITGIFFRSFLKLSHSPLPHGPKDARFVALLGETGFAGGGRGVARITLLVHEARELGG